MAGCVTFGAQPASAEITVNPVLDTLHSSNVKIPQTDSVYPASEYTLTEVTPEDVNNLSLNVIKYYDSNNLDKSVHYLQIGFKNPVYGEGDSAKYFKWSKDGDSVKLVETTSASDAVLTIKYNSSTADKVYAQKDTQIASVNEIYVGKDIKGLIGADGRIESVTSDFIGNTLQITSADDYNSSAIYTEADGQIGTVASSFIGNNITVDSNGGLVHATLIKSLGSVDNVNSEFVGNTVTSNANIFGGLVEAQSSGTIGNITSDFIRNTVTTTNTSIRGSIVRNDGKMNITDSRFVENAGISTDGKVYGGAIENSGTTNGKGLTVTNTVFTGNKVVGVASDVYGGAIANSGTLQIENSVFKDNYAQSTSGTAHGGAIYTSSDFTIAANNGKTTEFTDNYTLNGVTKTNEAIYVDSDLATLTLNATDNGRILLNDIINGQSGYNVLLTGDLTGRISLYNSILNADVTAQNVNIDMADSAFKTYDFLTLKSNDSAKFTIDVDFQNNNSDKFALGTGSSGVIYLNDLNLIGGAPTTSQIIQILTGPDTISIGLTEDLLNRYHKISERDYGVSENLTSSATWGKTFGAHLYKDTIEEGLRTAISGADRTSADSLEYYVNTTTEDLGVVSSGDTMMLMNQSDKFATKTFSAKSSDDTYTLKANLGQTSGTFNVNGYNSSSRNVVDAAGHTMYEIGDGARVNLQSLTINNLANTDGSLMKISEGGTGKLNCVNVNGNENTASIVNDGVLTLTGGKSSNLNTFTGAGIKGFGTTTISGYWDFAQGASIIQDTINILSDGNLYIYADGLQGNSIVEGNLYLKGGVLNSVLSGGGNIYIDGDTALNIDVDKEIILRNAGVNLTTNADHLLGGITQTSKTSSDVNSIVTLTGGTLTSNIEGYNRKNPYDYYNGSNCGNWLDIVIDGDLNIADGAVVTYKNMTINETSSLTASGDSLDSYWYYYVDKYDDYKNKYIYGKSINDGTMNITGGTLDSLNLGGSGTLNIIGEVTTKSATYVNISQNKLHIKDGAILHYNGGIDKISDFINDGILDLKSGFGSGITVVNGSGNILVSGQADIMYTTLNQNVEILKGATLTTYYNKLTTDIINNGSLYIYGSGEYSSPYGTFSHNVSGDGTTILVWDNYNSNYYLNNEGQINTKNITVMGSVWSNADLLGGDISIRGRLNLTGGTLQHQASGLGFLKIDDNANVVSNAIISSLILLGDNSSLTVSADNLKGSKDIILYNNANLKLKSGTLERVVKQEYQSSGGIITILADNDVIYNVGKATDISVIVDGTFTVSADDLTGTVTNNGSIYLSGLLNRKYAGTGETYIDETLHIKSGAGFPGTFNLNGGTLISDAIASYTFGHTTGSGNLVFNINAGFSSSDKFTLASTSDAEFNISDISFFNTNNIALENTTKTYQVLKGGSSSNLVLSAPIQKLFEIDQATRDVLKDPNVYFDDSYVTHHRTGILPATIELATTQTNNDSVKVSYGAITWNDPHETRQDLFAAWNQLSTKEIRNFNFRTSDDVYTSVSNAGNTSSGTININGVSTTTTDADGNTVIKRSAIDLDGHNGIYMQYSDRIANIQDVEFRNAGPDGYFVNGNGSIGSLLEDGTVHGGIINTAFKDITPGETGAVSGYKIYQIKDSLFSNISGIGIYNGGGSYIGVQDTDYGITNTVFENVNTAIYNYDSSKIYNIKDSSFLNNRIGIDNYTHYKRSEYIGSVTIDTIDNCIFSNNTSYAIRNYAYADRAKDYLNATINSIKNCVFSNNSSASIYTDGRYSSHIAGDPFRTRSIIGVIDNCIFENNKGTSIRFDYYSETGKLSNLTFSNNSTTAILCYGKITTISDSIFDSNSFTSRSNVISIARSTSSIGEMINLTFSNNSTSSGNIISNSSTINTIGNSTFINNLGCAIGNFEGTVNEISDSTFSGNSSSSGGAIYNSGTIREIVNSTFEGNSSSAYSSSGGAIYNSGTISEIVNSTFRGNTNTSSYYYYGGAIYNSGTITISARDIVNEDGTITNGLTEFTDNYKGSSQTESNKYAIYNYTNSSSKTATMTLKAENNGVILMNDKIKNDRNSSYAMPKLNLTGDSTGTIKLFDTVEGGDITANNVNINTANSKTQYYTFNKFTSEDSAKWTIDVDFANNKADKFTVGNGTGVMYIDNLNIIGNADKYTQVKVLDKSKDTVTVDDVETSTTQLALNSENVNIVTDIRDTLEDTVYNNETYHQEAGYAVASSKKWNISSSYTKDMISQCIDEDLDALNLIVSSTKNEVRNFVFRDGSTYTVSQDLDDMYSGTLNIKGVEGAGSTIDANGHKLFNLLGSGYILNLSDVKLTGTDSLIKGSYSKVNISGTETILDGRVESATTLESGNLKFNTDTFSGSTLTLNGGTLALDNATVENYTISKLISNRTSNSNISIDLDTATKTADKITVRNSGIGTITVSNVNYLNELQDHNDFVVQVIKNSSSSTVQLALDDSIKHHVFEEYSRLVDDEVTEDTDFNDTFNKWSQRGMLFGDLYLTKTSKTNDSIGIKFGTEWDDSSKTFIESLGDTFDMVNSSTLNVRNFNSTNAGDKYNLSVDLGKTAAGTLNINGTLDADGNRSTINFKNHDALQLGEDTTISVNNTRLTGARDIMTVDSESTKVILKNAYINGNIIGNKKFQMLLDGLDTTTIVGSITNSDVTFKNGGLILGENTFADSNTTLTVQDYATVYLNDGDVSNYNISNINSSILSKYGLDIDLKDRTADTVTAEGSGRIVLEKFDILNNLANVTINDNYTIQILKTSNDSLQLEISETIKSQLKDPYKLGTVREIVSTDEINPTSQWTDLYYQNEADYDIYGKLKLATKETTNDSLHLYELRKHLADSRRVLGDTLQLLSTLETDSDRLFVTSVKDTYTLGADIGNVTSGKLTLQGVTDESGHSVIDMNAYKGFHLSNETEMSVLDVTFENAGYKDGSLIKLSNENAVLNLNNVTITDTASTNAIENDGTVNMTGGKVLLYSGITGEGVTNVEGADVTLTEGLSLTQEQVNVNSGNLVLAEDSTIVGTLTVGESGTAKMATSGITSAVENNGALIFTGGELVQNITGTGTTKITGVVVNNAEIAQDVDVQSGEFTTSADNIGGVINNNAITNLTGTLTNVVTGNGTTNVDETLALAQGAGVDGTLNLNEGLISATDSKTTDYTVGTMLNYGTFDIDVDLSAKKSDKFTVGNTSNGTVYIDSINYLNELKENETFKIQVLETNGTDAIQLALNEELTKLPFAVGTVTVERDDLRASVYFDENFSDYEKIGTIYGSLHLATTKTSNDSIELAYTETIWGDETSTERVDTLKQLNLYELKDDETEKNFNFRTAENKYTVVEDLGETTEGIFNINGVSDGDKKSEIDLNVHKGFELTNDTTLNLNDVEIGNAKDDNVIIATNPDAVVNIKNTTIDGNITGNSTEINITGGESDVTILNGTITDGETTLEGGTLKFNTDTFSDSSDTLTVDSGRIDVQDSKVDTYDINKLTSSEDGKYSIDIDLTAQTSDKFDIEDTTSSGVVYIDEINYINGELPTEFVAQILETNGNDNIQIKLSDEIKDKSYHFKDVEENWNDLKADVDFDEFFHDYHRDGEVRGSIKEATTKTTNDSISLKMDAPIWGETEVTNRKDTLHEISNYVTESDKTFNFKTGNDLYESKTDVGKVNGTLTVNGVSDGEEKSVIDLNNHNGFELISDTVLNLNDVTIGNAANDNLIIAKQPDSVVNITNNTLNGNIKGNDTEINVTGDDTDITTINGQITGSDTTLNGGTLKFNTDTFKDGEDSLIVSDGRIDVQDSKVDTYDINKLTSSEDGKYSIDIDLTAQTSDKFNLKDATSAGIVYIDDINYINGELPTEFIAQILETNGNSNIQIKLSDEIKSKIYDLGFRQEKWDDMKSDVDFDEIIHDYYREGEVKGSIKEATIKTINDSIELKYDSPNWGETEITDRLDTLHEIAKYESKTGKTFNFKTSNDVYESKSDVGSVNGKLSINGVKDNEKMSLIDLKEFKGFELVKDSKLNVNNTLLSNGADNTLITATDESAEVTLNNSAVNGIITGVNGYKVTLTGDKSYTFDVNHEIQNANINLDTIRLDFYNPKAFGSSDMYINSGTLNLTADRSIADISAKSVTVNNNFNMLVDADLQNQIMDKLPKNTIARNGASINVAGINLLSDTEATTVAIPFAYTGFKDNVKYTGNPELSKETQITTAYAPIYKYEINYDNRDDMGYFVFARSGIGGHNTSENYNPAVLASPVATQAVGQSAMNETFRYVFEHADAFTQLPAIDRISEIKANQYAISTDFNHNLGSLCTEHNNKAGWFRPYSTFETINLSNGPKVNTINYGSLVGYDSDFRHLKHGWHNVGTGYIGYNGSQMNYNGVNTTMNGGVLGLTETFYKGNFWTALTATAGAGVSETRTMYGKEDSTTIMGGIGSKTGYNFEFKEGKYILQPIMFMSYTMVKTLDYTNAAGVRLNNSPMHTIQLNPSVRFISNLKGGWQPYASVGMVWNLMNEAHSTANGIKLPEMHTKPYIEYGLGLQRNIKDRFTAFGQAMVRNGGRNGIALTAGLRWSLGHEGHPIEKVQNVNNKTLSQLDNKLKVENKITLESKGLPDVSKSQPRKILKQLDAAKKTPLTKGNTTRTTYRAVLKQL